MHIASLGADPLADLPLGVTNPDRWDLLWATMPTGVWTGPSIGIPVPTVSEQVCPLGDPSDDPLIPGVCNTSALVGAAALLGLLMVMNR